MGNTENHMLAVMRSHLTRMAMAKAMEDGVIIDSIRLEKIVGESSLDQLDIYYRAFEEFFDIVLHHPIIRLPNLKHPIPFKVRIPTQPTS